jgi:hypothetical protein
MVLRVHYLVRIYIKGVSMDSVFLLMHLFFSDPSMDMVAGVYNSYKECNSAKVNSNLELLPNVTVCIKVNKGAYYKSKDESLEFSLMMLSKNSKD